MRPGNQNPFLGFTELMYGGLRWTAEIPTNSLGITRVEVLFKDLKATVSAKRVALPFSFNSSSIS